MLGCHQFNLDALRAGSASQSPVASVFPRVGLGWACFDGACSDTARCRRALSRGAGARRGRGLRSESIAGIEFQVGRITMERCKAGHPSRGQRCLWMIGELLAEPPCHVTCDGCGFRLRRRRRNCCLGGREGEEEAVFGSSVDGANDGQHGSLGRGGSCHVMGGSALGWRAWTLFNGGVEQAVVERSSEWHTTGAARHRTRPTVGTRACFDGGAVDVSCRRWGWRVCPHEPNIRDASHVSHATPRPSWPLLPFHAPFQKPGGGLG